MSIVITLILYRSELRHRKGEALLWGNRQWLAQGHASSEWQSQDSNLGGLAPESFLLTASSHYLLFNQLPFAWYCIKRFLHSLS